MNYQPKLTDLIAQAITRNVLEHDVDAVIEGLPRIAPCTLPSLMEQLLPIYLETLKSPPKPPTFL